SSPTPNHLLDPGLLLLAASSDYFRAMFTSGMKESQQLCVNLPFLEASELEALISCTYSGSIQLNWGCVFEISCTALQLQFQHILSMCLSFLEKEMNAHSCLDVASFAEAYGMQELLETANKFVLRHFQNVATTPKFQDLPANKLRKYLKSNSLLVTSELVVFKAVAVWIEACPSKRLRFAKELMKSIFFPLMTDNEFKEVKTAKLWTQCNTKRLYQTILEDFHSYYIAPRTLCRVYQPKDSLVLVGGDQISADLSRQNPSRELWFGNSLKSYIGLVKNVEWRLLTEMPNPPRLSHDVAVLAEKLYVVGGQDYSGRLNVLKSSLFPSRYDPIQNSWERLADLQEKRCNFSIVVFEGMLYAIGGDSDPETNLKSVESYCMNTDSWRPLDMTLSCHAATVLDGKIFISGGYHQRYRCLTSMFTYHPERGTIYLADMRQPRAYHCMETLHGHLYVAGGITLDEDKTSIDQLTCEVYDPVTDTWSAFTNLPIPHVGAASVVLEGMFYVLGGYFKDNYRETRLVHRYDPMLQFWENMGVMPGPNTDIRACLIHLPNHLRKCQNI
uniref:Kelch-like family member 33 n=1 Tax=Esox lucius TaxID=8010 RepID=A0AAY5KME6_ESOLU